MIEFLEPETCRKIYDLLVKNPGLTLSLIAEKLNTHMSLIEQCLNSMELRKEIISLQERGSTRYYIRKKRKGRGGTRDRRTQEIRKQIFDLLLINPGLNLSKIAEKLNMSAQLAEYHLLYMQRNNLIIGVKEKGGYYKRFYVKDSEVDVKDKKIVALLRQEHLLRIVIIILKKPNIKHKELSRFLDIHPSTLSYHLNRLDEYGILNAVTYGKESGYNIRNKKEIIWIIRKYIIDVITERFRDMWEDLDPR